MTKAKRVGCLVVPALSLQASVRAEPSLEQTPCATAAGEGARAFVTHVSSRARAQGVREGFLLGEALALCPALVLRWPQEVIVAAARAAVIDAAASISPKVEELTPGVVAVELDGIVRLHGGERATAGALVAAVGRVGLVARASVAGGKKLARLAAERGDGIEIIPAGKERTFLAGLSVTALGASERLAATLQRWGIGDAGALSLLPIEGVGARLGAEGVQLHRLACGIDDAPLQPLPQPTSFEESCALDHELTAIEGLLFLLRPAYERLVTRLDCHGLSCGGLTLRLLLDAGGEVALCVELAAPTREVSSLLSLTRAVIERKPPGAPVRGVRIEAIPSVPRREQLRLFGRPTVAPEKLAATIAKVAALVGEDRVGAPLLCESHEPEAFALGRFDPPPPPDAPKEAPKEAAPVAVLRAFRPPLPAQVRMGRQGPEVVRAGSVTGWVVSCAGPWRLEANWHAVPYARDAFDVELSDGAVYRLAQERTTGAWSLLGRYDG